MRHGFSLIRIVLPVVSCVSLVAQMEPLYIGTYTNTAAQSRGIYSAHFDANTGSLSDVSVAAETANPSFLARHPYRPILYAVNEVPDGTVSSFAIGSKGELKFLGKSPTGGAAPCHLIVDRSGKWLLVANYNGANIAVMPILPDGKAGEPHVTPHNGSGPNPQQKEPHPHEIVEVAGNIILVPDLGADRIARYVLDSARGTLSPADPAGIRLPPGSGPRHLAASADGMKLYVLSELANTVTVFGQSNTGAAWSILQTIPLLLPQFEGRSTAAEIAMHPSGRYVYASNRGADDIVVFAIDSATGRLTRAGSAPTGATPRFFTIDPGGKWLLAAGQASNTVTVFAIDPAAGMLKAQSNPAHVPAPVFIGAGL
ncbi:MAG: 6-phosphogluconolactonase [Terriglobia bacterium]|nr:MAG: 6-phosphogluconolactonase [Terriglobia bacterium]